MLDRIIINDHIAKNKILCVHTVGINYLICITNIRCIDNLYQIFSTAFIHFVYFYISKNIRNEIYNEKSHCVVKNHRQTMLRRGELHYV